VPCRVLKCILVVQKLQMLQLKQYRVALGQAREVMNGCVMRLSRQKYIALLCFL